MTAVNISGVILVTCDGKQCQNFIKESKCKLKGVTSAFIVDKQTPDVTDVIITVDTISRDYIRAAMQIVVNMDGVKQAKYRIV